MRQQPPPELSQGRNGERRNCSFEAAHYYSGRAFEGPARRKSKWKRRLVEEGDGEAKGRRRKLEEEDRGSGKIGGVNWRKGEEGIKVVQDP